MLSGASCARNALRRPTRISPPPKAIVYEWHPTCARCLATRQTRTITRDAYRRPSGEDSAPHRPFFPRQTSSQLFAMSPDSRFAPPGFASHGARFKMQLAACAEEGNATRAVRLCAEMKKADISPDVSVYNWLIHACAKQGLGRECLAFLEDMEALNIKPTIDTYNHVIYAHRWSNTFNPESILDRMQEANVRPNTHTYHHIILRHTEAQNLEMCLQCFAEMSENTVSPSLKSTQAVIELASNLGNARLALDIAHAFEASSVRKLETEDWVRILTASTGCLFKQGVLSAWQKVVGEHHVTPDEGVCLEVLHTAGRHGLTNMALHSLEIINSLQVPLEEYHLLPILEAFCKHNMLEDAFSIVNLMRSSGIHISAESVLPILDCIRHDFEKVDQAWGVLEKMHANGKAIDVASLNAIVKASTGLQDLQRAVGIYKAYSAFGVKPSIETFNYILSGCIATSHKDLGDKMLDELQQQGLVPDANTFERIILLCLTQSTYEDAFFYLEEMKGQGHRPPLSVYEALVRKCVVSGDPRWKLAMEELEECGYVTPRQLRKFISTGGRTSGRVRWDVQDPNSVEAVSGAHPGADAAAQDGLDPQLDELPDRANTTGSKYIDDH